jgi:hypothetical protein
MSKLQAPAVPVHEAQPIPWQQWSLPPPSTSMSLYDLEKKLTNVALVETPPVVDKEVPKKEEPSTDIDQTTLAKVLVNALVKFQQLQVSE